MLPNVSGWMGSVSRAIFTSSVFSSLNLTFHCFAHSAIFLRSVLRISARVTGSLKESARLVSSANSLITDWISLTMSFMYIRKRGGT